MTARDLKGGGKPGRPHSSCRAGACQVTQICSVTHVSHLGSRGPTNNSCAHRAPVSCCRSPLCKGPAPHAASPCVASLFSFCFKCLWLLRRKPRGRTDGGVAEVSPPARSSHPSDSPLALWLGCLSVPKVQPALVPGSNVGQPEIICFESTGMDLSMYQRALLSERLTEQNGKSSTVKCFVVCCFFF